MFGTLSYLLCAVVAAVVGGVLLSKSRHGDLTRRGAIACAAMVLWGLILAGQSFVGAQATWVGLIVEVVRYGTWLIVLRALALNSPRWFSNSVLLLISAFTLYAILGWVGEFTRSFQFRLSGVAETGGLLLAFAGLVATEQAMRSVAVEHSRTVRLCAAGVGGQFAFDLFLFSQAQLLGAVDPTAWMLRGVVSAVLLIPFSIGVLRLPAAEPRVFISRHVVFYTSAFVAVGSYLCLMALGGYYVREKGGDWGNALQVVFLCGAGAVLALLLLSDSPLRRLRVFIATHFYRNKFDYRIEWMRFVQTLSAADEPDLKRTAVRAVAQIFGSSGGLLLLRDEDTNRFTLSATWPETYEGKVEHGSLAVDHPLPVFLRQRQWVIDLKEYRANPALYGALDLPPWLDPDGEWRVIAPLLVGAELLGFL